jgi:ABC-type amino acid transport substrate-binding protein
VNLPKKKQPTDQSDPSLKPSPVAESPVQQTEELEKYPVQVVDLRNRYRDFWRWFRLALISVPLVIILSGATYGLLYFLQKNPAQEPVVLSRIQRIYETGKVKIGTDPTFPPMEFEDPEGNLFGYDIDLGNRLAEELDLEPEFVKVSWDNLFQELIAGNIDMVISGVSITEERKARYHFSQPYINAGQVIMTRRRDTEIKEPADLYGKRIAVQKETTNEEEALKYTQAELVLTYDDFLVATQALLSGQADAIIADLTLAKSTVDAHPELKIASDPFTSDFYGIVFAKDNLDFATEVDAALEGLQQRGVLVFLKQKWLD